MKILFITDLYPVDSSEKSTPRTLFNFVEEWRKQGHKVDVIKPNFILNSFLRGKPFYKSAKYNDVININYWTPFWFNIKSKIKNFNIDFASYDTVIAHMPSGILFADKLGVPFVAGIHISDLQILTKPFYKIHFTAREKKALKNAQKIACRSYVIKDKLLKLFPEFETKTFTAFSGINDINISNSETKNSKTAVLTCAHLKKRKNIDLVIKACKGLNVSLTVAGDGILRKSLEKLDKSVIFTGYLKHNDVLNLMRKSGIFILPSIGETFGMVYLEAMSQGCITVCTEGDGISGIIKDGENGYLVKPDVEGIRKLIEKIINTDDVQLDVIRQNAKETVKNLSQSKCANDYLQQIFKIS